MFKFIILIHPLGLMYGSAGGFLSPENLVGRSGSKFPPEAATLAGLFFSSNKVKPFTTQEELRCNLHVAGPFWAECDKPDDFYVPIPWIKIIGDETVDEWKLSRGKWLREKKDIEPAYRWQNINYWNDSATSLKKNEAVRKSPWEFVPILHPRTKEDERCTLPEDGLFLENAVKMEDDTCLVYLSTHELPEGWYRFGGENHLVEITSLSILEDSCIYELLAKPIEKSCALITPGLWGSNQLSYRYPKHPDFPKQRPLMLTDRPIPYRYRLGDGENNTNKNGSGRMSRGRYAVPPGTVYVFPQSLSKNWSSWSDEWFPQEGFSLKKVGCNLCLPIDIEGVV
ncbi:MAG: CRISPR-associated protein [Scytonematopsis contorta HA4267-MV1]|jgi:CRISPR-associated protein Cmr3|nr:CRISPR-associated protein [Scytonematopsis contorta HA4267-MV1]